MGLRKMDLEPQTMRFLRAHPDSTAAEIAAGIGAKPNSVRVCLKRWVDAGMLTSKGRKNITYRVAEGSGHGR